jgi:hypothetical protein
MWRMQGFLVFVYCAASTSSLLAQNMGSVAAERAARQNERNAMEFQAQQDREAAEWQQAKKLALSEVSPNIPRAGSGQLASIKAGWVGHLEDVKFRVVDIVNDTEVMLSDGKHRLWLIGSSTKDLVNDQTVVIIGPVRAGETRTYSTVAGGTNTVRTVTLLSAEESELLFKQEAEAKAAAEKRAAARTFTDSTGEHSFLGIFVDSKQGVVELERLDSGKRVKVKLAQLSKDDIAWVKNTLAEREQAEKQAKMEERKQKLRAAKNRQRQMMQGNR